MLNPSNFVPKNGFPVVKGLTAASTTDLENDGDPFSEGSDKGDKTHKNRQFDLPPPATVGWHDTSYGSIGKIQNRGRNSVDCWVRPCACFSHLICSSSFSSPPAPPFPIRGHTTPQGTRLVVGGAVFAHWSIFCPCVDLLAGDRFGQRAILLENVNRPGPVQTFDNHKKNIKEKERNRRAGKQEGRQAGGQAGACATRSAQCNANIQEIRCQKLGVDKEACLHRPGVCLSQVERNASSIASSRRCHTTGFTQSTANRGQPSRRVAGRKRQSCTYTSQLGVSVRQPAGGRARQRWPLGWDKKKSGFRVQNGSQLFTFPNAKVSILH